MKLLTRGLLTLALLGAGFAQAQQTQTPPGAEDPAFATIDGQAITRDALWQAFRAGVRQRFYHGQVPEHELETFARETANRLIDETLILQYARRTGTPPDREWVDTRVEAFAQANQDKPVFQTHKEQLLERVRDELEATSLLRVVEQNFRDQVRVSEAEVREFFDQNPDLFTEPEQVRVGLILVKVHPGAPKEEWDAAREQVRALYEQIQQGEAFEAVAREHSQDASAEAGGDMGYLHQGMLGGYAQGVVDKLETGQVSEPFSLLEGIALMKLTDRKQPRKVSFEEARDRAAALALPAKKDSAWKAFVAGLRKDRNIEIDEAVIEQVRARAAGRVAPAPGDDSN